MTVDHRAAGGSTALRQQWIAEQLANANGARTLPSVLDKTPADMARRGRNSRTLKKYTTVPLYHEVAK